MSDAERSEMEEAFKELAETFVSTISESLRVELKYDAESVAWADGFIERQRSQFTGAEADGLVNVIGAFLGECLIANYGGCWRENDEGVWGVYFDKGTAAFPFAKVRKQFDNGHEGGDSIESFYEVIPAVLRSMDDVV